MSSILLDRRQFLTLPLALALTPLASALGAEGRRVGYTVDIAILYGTMRFGLRGTLEETVDRKAGRYEVLAAGQGRGIANRIESAGTLRGGRWMPTRSRSWVQIAGRETITEITYDHDRGFADYRTRAETFFLRRLRVVEDLVQFPAGPVDDASSAVLNYSEHRWAPDEAGVYQTHVVRRKRSPREGPDDVEKVYRAEVIPLILNVKPDRETGKSTAAFDLTGFSSWAREDQPARIVFGHDGWPERITSSLILGTSITIQMTPPV
jgi:hypothetical protein